MTLPEGSLSRSGLPVPVPIAYGGTGSTTQNFVDLTTAQSISGMKDFTGILESTGTLYVPSGETDIRVPLTNHAGTLYTQSIAANVVNLTVMGLSAQTAALQQWVSSAGSVLAQINQVGSLTLQGGGINPLDIVLTNTDYTNTGGANSHILMTNPAATGQSVVASVINGAMVAKWRTDYDGNISWVAGAPGGTTGSHNFYVMGDFGTANTKTMLELTSGLGIGFYGATPVVQPASPGAVATTAATNVTPYGFSTAAQANAIVTTVNAILAALSAAAGGNGLIA